MSSSSWKIASFELLLQKRDSSGNKLKSFFANLTRYHVAGGLAAVLSMCAVVACLVFVPMVVFKLGSLKQRVEKEMATFKVNSNDIWKNMMELHKELRPKRQSPYGQSGRGNGINNGGFVGNFPPGFIPFPFQEYGAQGSSYGNGQNQIVPHAEPTFGQGQPGESYPQPDYGPPGGEFPQPPGGEFPQPPGGEFPQPPGGYQPEPGYPQPPGPGPRPFPPQPIPPPTGKCVGPPGTPGIAGSDGKPGPPGQNGLPGKNGDSLFQETDGEGCQICPSGHPGFPGPPGPPGLDGPKGYPGNSGLPAITGNQDYNIGPPGAPGPPGRDGNPGFPGQDGQDVQGGKGEPGFRGPPGFPGPPGLPGRNGGRQSDPRPGNPGPPGRPGPPGLTGPVGRPGSFGESGTPGTDAQYCPCPGRGPSSYGPQPGPQQPYNPGPQQPFNPGPQQPYNGGQDQSYNQNQGVDNFPQAPQFPQPQQPYGQKLNNDNFPPPQPPPPSFNGSPPQYGSLPAPAPYPGDPFGGGFSFQGRKKRKNQKG